ncbi:MAG: type II secretion system protein [Kiritimatiellae bacterium]|nr:type II secretion system protein [Kiritimatiellia bacterium]
MKGLFRRRSAAPAGRAGGAAAFTLVELLVVVAIIGVLATLLGSAIMTATKTANKKRADNNAELLRAAIVEFWHDNGRWPVDAKALKSAIKKIESGSGSKTKVAGGTDERVSRNYQVSFYADNNEVVKNLLDFKTDSGVKKTYLNLHGFVTPANNSLSSDSYPTDDTVDAWLAYEDGQGAISDLTGEVVRNRKDPVLLYRSEMYKCPECHKLYKSKVCKNSECPFYKSNDYYKPLNRRDRVYGARPFRIKFDFNDNTVSVSTD